MNCTCEGGWLSSEVVKVDSRRQGALVCTKCGCTQLLERTIEPFDQERKAGVAP